MKSKLITFLILAFFCLVTTHASPEKIMHRGQATNQQEDGLHLAESTNGLFSVLVPSPFNDATIDGNSGTSYILSSIGPDDIKYVALFALNNNDGVIKTYDKDSQNENIKKIKHKGMPSLYTEDTITGSDGVAFAMMLRVKLEEGVIILMVTSPPAIKDDAIVKAGAFFDSLAFTSE